MADASAQWAKELESKVVSVTRLAAGRYVVEVPAHCEPAALIADLSACGGRVISLTPLQQTLEDFFVDRVTDGRGDAEAPSLSA